MIEPVGYVGTHERIDQVMIRKADLKEVAEGMVCLLLMRMGPNPIRFARLSMIEESETMWIAFVD